MEDNQDLDPNAVADLESAVWNAIERGDLQLLLPPDSPVKILTGLDPGTGTAPITRGTDGDEGLSNGAISGIVVAALIVALLPIALYVGMRRSHEEKEPYGAYEPHDEADADEIGPEEDVEAKHISKSSAAAAAAAAAGGGTLGAKPTNYGKKEKSSEPIEHMHKVAPVSPDSRGDDDERSHASSSNAGSSGWSSSAGMSSLNTGSAEDSMDMLHSPQGASLAAIAAASASSRKTERSANLSPYVSRRCSYLFCTP